MNRLKNENFQYQAKSFKGIVIRPQTVNVSFVVRIPNYVPEISNIETEYLGWKMVPNITSLGGGKKIRYLMVSALLKESASLYKAMQVRSIIYESFMLFNPKLKEKRKAEIVQGYKIINPNIKKSFPFMMPNEKEWTPAIKFIELNEEEDERKERHNRKLEKEWKEKKREWEEEKDTLPF